MVWIASARIYFVVSRRIRSRPFFTELSFEAWRRGGTERYVAGIDADGNGGRANFRSSTALAVSQNVNHHRHSAWSRVAGYGRRASAGNAAGALDFYYAD